MPESTNRDEFTIRQSHAAPESPNLSVEDGLCEPMPKKSDIIQYLFGADLSGISPKAVSPKKSDFIKYLFGADLSGISPKVVSSAAGSSSAGPSTVTQPVKHLCNVCSDGIRYSIPEFQGGTSGGGNECDGINFPVMQILQAQGGVDASVPTPSSQAGTHQPMDTNQHIENLLDLAKHSPVSSVKDPAQQASKLVDLRARLKVVKPADGSSKHILHDIHYYAKSLVFLADDIYKTRAYTTKLDKCSNAQDQEIYVFSNVEPYHDLLNKLLDDLTNSGAGL